MKYSANAFMKSNDLWISAMQSILAIDESFVQMIFLFALKSISFFLQQS